MKHPCPRCGREQGPEHQWSEHRKDVVAVFVEHGFYGCDTGCCGHYTVGIDAEGQKVSEDWDWNHPSRDEDGAKFAASLARHYWPDGKVAFLPERCEVSAE